MGRARRGRVARRDRVRVRAESRGGGGGRPPQPAWGFGPPAPDAWAPPPLPPAPEGHRAPPDRAAQWSLSPIELPPIVLPGWAGFGGQTYWGGMPFPDYPNAYVGMISVVLALPAFLANGPARVFALALALVSLLIAFGHNTPLYGFLYAHLPLFNKFRIPVMIILLFHLAACLAAPWGWSTVLQGREGGTGRAPRVDRLMAITAIVLAAGALLGTIGRDGWRAAYLG